MPSTWRVLLWPLVASLAGAATVVLSMWAVVGLAGAQESTGRGAGILVAVVGVLFATGLSVTVWVLLLAVAARRLFPRGQRLTPLLQAVGLVLGLLAATYAFVAGSAAAISDAVGEALPLTLLLVALGCALVAPSVVFLLTARRLRARPWLLAPPQAGQSGPWPVLPHQWGPPSNPGPPMPGPPSQGALPVQRPPGR